MDKNFFKQSMALFVQMLLLQFILFSHSEAYLSAEEIPVYSTVEHSLDQFENIFDLVFPPPKQDLKTHKKGNTIFSVPFAHTEIPFCFLFDGQFFPKNNTSSNFTSEAAEKIYALHNAIICGQAKNPILKVLYIGKKAETSSISFMKAEPLLEIYSVHPSRESSRSSFIRELQRLKEETPYLQFAFITSDKAQIRFWKKVLGKMKSEKTPTSLHYIILTPNTEEENADH